MPTGEETHSDIGLVHMNGRIYDPLLGRFLSADILVQNPGSLQSYNRYSYVFNNPLTRTDSTGFVVELVGTDEEKKRLQQRIDNQAKNDPKFAAQYKALSEAKNVGVRIGFEHKEAASSKASSGAESSDSSSKPAVASVDGAKPTTGSDGGKVAQKLVYTPISRVTQVGFTESAVDRSGEKTDQEDHAAQTYSGIDHPAVGTASDGGATVGFNLHQKVAVRAEVRADPAKLLKALARENEHVTDNSLLFNGAFKRDAIAALQNNFFSAKELSDTFGALDRSFQTSAGKAAAWWDSSKPSGQNYHDVTESLDSINTPSAADREKHEQGLR